MGWLYKVFGPRKRLTLGLERNRRHLTLEEFETRDLGDDIAAAGTARPLSTFDLDASRDLRIDTLPSRKYEPTPEHNDETIAKRILAQHSSTVWQGPSKADKYRESLVIAAPPPVSSYPEPTIESVVANAQQQIAELKAEHESKINRLEEKHQADINKLKTNLHLCHQDDLAGLRHDLERACLLRDQQREWFASITSVLDKYKVPMFKRSGRNSFLLNIVERVDRLGKRSKRAVVK